MKEAQEKRASIVPEMLRRFESEILTEWMDLQLSQPKARTGVITEGQLRAQSKTFLEGLVGAARGGFAGDLQAPQWRIVREVLTDLSDTRAQQGFSPAETAMFVFSLKAPLLGRLRDEYRDDLEGLASEMLSLSTVLDKLGLYTTEVYQKSFEQIIARQQQEMLELSTPVVRLWDGILALPLIGTLDSARTQVVMENLLQEIVSTGAGIAIIDITGVPTVDTLVAQHLLKTVAAARLMGADCLISGIRPQIAQTIVHLGVELNNVTTKASLSDAFAIALRRIGCTIVRTPERS
jgi:rsbT co-antagonist protein RsbR